MKTFIVYWLDGNATPVHGVTVEKAFTNSGYGAGALAAVDFYDEDSRIKYEFVNGNWVRKPVEKMDQGQ
jgi:hypothetical protein